MHVHDLDTPALLVDLHRLSANIASFAAIAQSGGKVLRPHVKTHKTLEIARLQVQAGARGITVAKLGEAEVMAEGGLRDIFLANQVVGREKVRRLVELLSTARVIVGVDSIEVARPISEACRSAGVVCPFRVEVDTGLDRAGVRSPEEAIGLVTRLLELPGLLYDGLYTYEGHANAAGIHERKDVCEAAAMRLHEIAARLEELGVPTPHQSAGSTMGAEHMAAIPSITELRCGNYVFLDMSQVARGASIEDCALSVLATVISRPSRRVAILDAGTKALSGDRAPSGSAHGWILDEPGIVFDWANEEHGHLVLPEAGADLKVGTKVRIVPYHACTTTNMHDELYVVEGNQVVETWRIAARGRLR